ncbi:MAG: aminotransferase class V-fold PLP-dependent enzyme [Bryobacteraceae bacterium]
MTRREMFRNSAYAAALFGVPASAATNRPAPSLPASDILQRDPEAYWTKIRDDQFMLPGWRAFMNNGSLGIAPRPVVDAVTDYLNRSAALDLEEYPRWGYETLDELRTELAAYLGCNKDNVAMMHNATEALSTVAAGVDLKAGDEVVMTDQEHSSGKSGWYMRKERHGIQVREVKIPLPPKDSGQLADIMISAIGPQTRVLLVSAILSPTGLIMPVREICEAARAKGVITLVDGAHVHGQINMPISALGCDYFVGSPHKWMFAPAGCGFLYIREENLDKLWPNTVTSQWADRTIKAARFQMFGTNNRSIFEGLQAGIKFANQIGPDRIYDRIHYLARTVYTKAAAIPYLELLTPENDALYGSLVTFRINKKPDAFFEACKKKRIWTTGSQQLRVSTHIHTRPQDIDLMFATMRETLG